MRHFSLIVMIMIFCSCSIFSPYSSEFTCPQKEKGKCVNVKEAYKESLTNQDNKKEIDQKELLKMKQKETGCKEDSDCPDDLFFSGQCTRCSMISDENFVKNYSYSVVKQKKATEEDNYTTAKYDKLKKLIKEPVTPVIAPPIVLRVLLLPYEDEGELYTQRYMYIMVDEPKWVLGDYLIKKEIDY